METVKGIKEHENKNLIDRVFKMRTRYYETKPSVCVERDVLYAESYKSNPYDKKEIRMAKAFRHVLEKIPIIILEDELIVGSPNPKIRSTAVYPELGTEWLKKDIKEFPTRAQDPFEVSNETMKILTEELFPYWEDKNLSTLCLNRIPEIPKKLIQEGLLYIYWYENAPGHIAPNYALLMQKGIEGVMRDALDKLDRLNPTKVKDLKKIDFLKAIVIVCDGVIRYANRYAERARVLASVQSDAWRKKELEEIAQVCERVPVKPVRTFWEALQFVNFVQILSYVESKNGGTMIGRLDQYAYPYYVRDIQEGRITKEQAHELLECFYVKIAELVHSSSNVQAYFTPGYNTFQQLSVGGLDKDGNDATNELSYMCLEAARKVKLHQPAIVAIFSEKTPHAFYDAVLDTLLAGTGGQPALINADTGIKTLLAEGASIEDARACAGAYGCVQYHFLGKGASVEAGISNLPSDLERALYNGFSPMVQKVIGPRTGNAREFRTYEELLDALHTQIGYMNDLLVQATVEIWRYHEEEFPLHWESIVVEGCVQKGIRAKSPYEVGPPYPCFATILPSGLITVANSLAAVKKLVFEEKKLTMCQLIDALEANFEGYEDIRLMLINDAPKFGNDDDTVDEIARDLQKWLWEYTKRYKTEEGHRVGNNYNLINSNVPMGLVVGATPDGRKMHEPLADNISPAHGTEQNGPTSVLKSVSKFDQEIQGQNLLNMKFSPAALRGQSRQKFIDMLKGYWKMGGYHVQFNVIEPEELIEAQTKPEQYKDLIVRIAGYSAHFTDLQEVTQNDIIDRTMYTF